MTSRSEFEKKFFNPESSLYRRAVLMFALAEGPDWKVWAAQGKNPAGPTFYNEIGFMACYGLYRNDPTVGRTIQMRDFMVARNANDSGWLADPVNKDSEARKQAQANVRETIVGFTTGPNKGDASQGSLNVYTPVYSEMWLHGAAMRQFIALPGLADAIRTLQTNVNRVKLNKSKTDWLVSLTNRFAGTSELSKRFGESFDTTKLGFTGTESGPTIGRKRGPQPIVMGGHRRVG